jgi:benzoylformate decarboxylase
MRRLGKNAIVEQLEADGVRFVFGNPGTVEQGLLDALGDSEQITYVLALQEAVAAGIADGYARSAKAPTILQLHSGVGLGNGIGMMYQAMRGHAPLVVVAGESGVRYDAMEAQMASDLVAMARPVTKWATRVLDPDSVLRVLRRAVRTAMTEPRGPVFVALPMDVLDAPNTEPVFPTPIPDTTVLPVPELVDRAAALLAGGTTPLLLVGDGVAVAGAEPEVAEIAELLGADVWSVDSSEPNIDALHPLSRGGLGHMFGQVSTAAVADADRVLVVGTYLFPEVFPELADPFRADARIVHVDLDAHEIGKNHPVDLGLVADPKPTLAALAARLRARLSTSDLQGAKDRVAAGHRRQADRLAARDADRESEPLLAAFCRELAERAPEDVVVFDEALTASPTVAAFLPPRFPGHNFLTRGGSLGVGLPGAVGIKLHRPDKTVIGFTGDGGSMYTFQALWTAARYGVAAKFVVCNNHRYKLLDDNIEQYWRERDLPEHAFPGMFDLAGPDLGFVDLARGLSVPAVRVEKPEQVAAAVESMLGHPGPFLVDLRTD